MSKTQNMTIGPSDQWNSTKSASSQRGDMWWIPTAWLPNIGSKYAHASCACIHGVLWHSQTVSHLNPI